MWIYLMTNLTLGFPNNNRNAIEKVPLEAWACTIWHQLQAFGIIDGIIHAIIALKKN